LVAAACHSLGKPFHFNIQGGGEPSQRFTLCQAVRDAVAGVCARAGLPLESYTSTNGVMDPENARWFARNFRSIAISVDGPPAVHDRLRFLRGGGPTSASLERTVAVFRDEGLTPLSRTTVTRDNVQELVSTVEYLRSHLDVREARFEPVYDLTGDGAFQPAAEAFVFHFLRAVRRGEEIGCAVAYSGYRPGEPHGPYCNVLRDVLYLTSGGQVSACPFEDSGCDAAGVDVGGYDAPSQRIVLDHPNIARLQAAAARSRETCLGCEVEEHCVKGCPDVCVLSSTPHRGSARGRLRASLRCRINRLLAPVAGSAVPAYTAGGRDA
jgi:radical SAM protein with 4Fe4S-binding SPASM domain